MNRVLTIAEVCNEHQTAPWTEDLQKHCTLQNKKSFPTWKSLVWWKWSTSRNHSKSFRHTGYKKWLDGSYRMRPVATGCEQTVSPDAHFYAGAPKLTTLRGLLDGSPITSAERIKCQSNQRWKYRWTVPRCGFARKVFKVSKLRHQLWIFTAQ